MLRWTVVAVAGVAYAIVTGCVLLGGAAAAPPATGEGDGVPRVVDVADAPATARAEAVAKLPIRAVGMQLQRTDWIERYKQSIDEIADLGADAVKIVVDARQENGTSTKIYLDLRMTPSAENLAEIIRHAKGRGLKVILMPIVLLDAPKGNEWRGTLKPDSWPAWFESYRDMLGHFLWIAQGNGVDLFVIGSELVSSERQAEEWDKTVAFVRGRYDGLITYSSNWDHYAAIPFWEKLDLIGMNSYWTLGDSPDVPVETIAANWRKIQDELRPFVMKKGKPLIFLEVGWCSLENAAEEPWDYTKDLPVDLDLQRRLYEGFFRAWEGVPWLGGFSIWEWPPGEGGPEDKGYTPKNKPAEKVLRENLAEPRWEVRVGA